MWGRPLRRRDLFRYAGALALVSTGGLARAQPTSTSVRGAVVIGVDNITGMPRLSASRDADKVEQWLIGEGFDVKKFTDADGGQVTDDDLYEAIEEFLQRPELDMLLVYFAGHGLANGATELWLLSGAPENPSRAVSFLQSTIFGQYCQVPNVVLISDACRSIPMTPQTSLLMNGGSPIFPNFGPGAVSCQVDTLKAASFGAAAYEELIVNEIAAKGGIFTAVLMEAFKNPWDDMTETLTNGEVIIKTNKLGEYLKTEVNNRAQAISINYSQIPEISATSNGYIAKVHTVVRSAPTAPAPVTPNDVLDFELRKIRAEFNNEGADGRDVNAEISGQSQFCQIRDGQDGAEPQPICRELRDAGGHFSGGRPHFRLCRRSAPLRLRGEPEQYRRATRWALR